METPAYTKKKNRRKEKLVAASLSLDSTALFDRIYGGVV
jgi:hypothetical protein